MTNHCIKYSCHPNNESRVTMYPVKPSRKLLLEEASAILGVSSSEVEEKRSTKPSHSDPSLPLVIRSEFKTICQAQSHVRTHFGMDASRRIMRAGGAMDRNDSVSKHYLFLTATLPSDEEFAKWAIAEDAHNIINGLKAWLSKRLQDRLEFYVWEHQERAALHLHYCIYMPNPINREWVKREFRREWMRLLQGTEKRLGVSMWGKWASKPDRYKHAILRTDVQEVKKSVAAYMAGYCNGVESKHKDDRKKDFYPKRWFGVSRPLSTLIKEHTKEEIFEYPNLREAKIAFEEVRHENESFSCHKKYYPHKIGTGETSVTYHDAETQEKLWQSKKMQYKKPQQNPVTRFWIQKALIIVSTCSELETSSQLYRASVSRLCREALSDTLYRNSLRRGSLHDTTVKAIESLYLELGSISSLPPIPKRLLRDVKHFCQLHSQNYHQIKYDRYGWLVPGAVMVNTVDIAFGNCDSRTTSEEDDTPGDGIPSPAAAANGTDSPVQASLF